MIQAKKTLKFKIVTPSFNQGHFISQTIDSVLSQLEAGDDYWVIDGNSTDQTIKILKSYGAKLNFVSEPDEGQTHALNKGIMKSGEMDNDTIFAYINSDDYYLPKTLERVRKIFADSKVNWVVGDAKIVDDKGNEIQKIIKIYKKILRFLPMSLWITNPYPQPSVFLRGSVVEHVGHFDEQLRYVMDYDYWLRCSSKFGTPFVLPDSLSAFRIHKSSKGGVEYKKQFKEDLYIAKKYIPNRFLFWLHQLHNQCILLTYGLIK